MVTAIELARQLSDAFETRKRDNGEEFRALKDGSPEWMRDVCRKAHGDFFPDDHRYDLIDDAVNAIARLDEGDDPSDAGDEWEPTPYNAGRSAWLASSVYRIAYVDEAMEEYGKPESIMDAIAWGMIAEFREVLDQVVSALKALADEDEDEE